MAKVKDLGNQLPDTVRGEYMTIAEQLKAEATRDTSQLIANNLFKLN